MPSYLERVVCRLSFSKPEPRPVSHPAVLSPSHHSVTLTVRVAFVPSAPVLQTPLQPQATSEATAENMQFPLSRLPPTRMQIQYCLVSDTALRDTGCSIVRPPCMSLPPCPVSGAMSAYRATDCCCYLAYIDTGSRLEECHRCHRKHIPTTCPEMTEKYGSLKGADISGAAI